MNKKNIFLFALSLVLILSASIGTTMSIFTTYAEAKGGHVVHIPTGGTEIQENFSNWTKRVVIQSEPDGRPVYVRARAFAGDQYELIYSNDPETPKDTWKWYEGKYKDNNGVEHTDGYWYYDDILYSGEVTTELFIRIEGLPEELENGYQFNVVVIYETTPVQYDPAGNPYADWSLVLDRGSN